MELFIFIILSVFVNISVLVGIFIIEQEVIFMGFLFFKLGFIILRIFEIDISGLIGQNVDFGRKDNKFFMLQFFVVGYFVEDMVFLVLVSLMWEMIVFLLFINNLWVEDKGNWFFYF